ncbi:hypothetical protein [Acinetobacter ursingii]|uniref:hypothetical protein n=1 Tax=Acinetobacter ursingii TaxID=108980 RepID=UPI001C0798CB|nr:hypothetical protein [Acinetobacter ursingii]MCU4521965.1 hypothetical protein [Acinetobacter ursingii]
MTVQAQITEVNFANRTVTVEAFQNGKKILKSPMRYQRFTKKDIESQIRKELKAYDGPLWGGAFGRIQYSDRRVMTMKMTLAQLVKQRRKALNLQPVPDNYAQSVKVDFFAVLERHFNKRGAA